ncbi:aromatic-L-amino-acid decarboxylase [Rhizoctonia solani AG-1 IA]|uniref:Aromatic-L-amino-acid decarboxylase n=1 Tax=Thanatephorus cucumeris (strain AG1-IA) TaxID=983506 RepID=L8WQ22_THACA|nr:aromatic-L-amino-acid decarboxylase [Rhizoctonia solani AG-1 IA]
MRLKRTGRLGCTHLLSLQPWVQLLRVLSTISRKLGKHVCGVLLENIVASLTSKFSVTKYPDIWLHIDAAWAGVALACPEFREISYLGAINAYAHSFCTNFHKWGLVNFDCSTLWVRDRTLLTDALDVTPEFLRTKHADAGGPPRNMFLFDVVSDPSVVPQDLFPTSFGVEGFQAHIRKGVELAKIFESLVEQSSLFEIVTPRSFALVVFRLRTPTALPTPAAATPIEGSGLSQEKELTAGASPDTTTTEARLRQSSQTKSNALNRAFYARISARKTILLTQTDLAGTFCIRMAIGTARTEEKHIREAFDLLVEEAQETLREWRD